MELGIIGLGVVGTANKKGFELAGHTVHCHDIKLNTTINDVKDAEIVFVCVPTPQYKTGSCNTSIVASVIGELSNINYNGIVAIKSSIYPGFTDILSMIYKNLNIAFVPEFLKERCALEDFTVNHKLLAIGTYKKEVYDLIVKAHDPYPVNKVMMSPTEAEVLKYFNNTFAALKITFANNFYEICNKLNCDYTKIKDTYIKTGKAVDMYLDVSDELRGYSGVCLPKDVNAIIYLMKEFNIDLDLIKSIDSDNQKLDKTVIGDMRKK